MKKIIHYFFDDVEIWEKNNSPIFRMCYASWLKYCPDYEIKLWHTGMPEFQEILKKSRFVRECYKLKWWALIADYIRHYALYNYGGIYLDTDVQLLKSFDEYLDKPFFCSIEGDVYKGKNLLEPAVMGGEKGHTVFKEVLDLYNSDEIFKIDYFIANVVMTEYFNRKIGFETINFENPKFIEEIKNLTSKERGTNFNNFEAYKSQRVFRDESTGAEIYPCEYFCPNWCAFGEKAFTENTVAIHWNQSSWWENSDFKLRKLQSLRYKNVFKQKLYLYLPKIAKMLTFYIPNKNVRKSLREKIEEIL